MHLTTFIAAMLTCLSLIVQVFSACTKSTFGSRRMNEGQVATYAEFTKALHKDILTGDIYSAKVGLSFAAQDDDWEQNFSSRAGFLLAQYLQICKGTQVIRTP